MNIIRIPIKGMHCASCEILVSKELKKIPDLSRVRVNQQQGWAEIEYNTTRPTDGQIAAAVKSAGYNIGTNEKLPLFSKNIADYRDLGRAAAILFVIYVVANWLQLFNLDVDTSQKGIWVALFVGLVAGLSTCMALIGGLVLGLSARHAEVHPEATRAEKFRPHIFFNMGRILGYAFLGGMIGLIGQAVKPSSTVLGYLTIAIGFVMVFFGLKLIEIFPILRDKNITLPSGIAKFFGLNKDVKEYSVKTAMVTGALTFFLPCGFTQAMQLYAVSTGSFWQGAAIMGLFALGTAPGLLSIGGLTSVFKGRKARLFFMTTGLAVLALGWFNISTGKNLLSTTPSNTTKSTDTTTVAADATVQEIRMTQGARGYTPNKFTVKVGKPVKWIINSTSQYSCAAYIIMSDYNIDQPLEPGENIITFTPTKTGKIPFSCSMGMYRGTFTVVE